MANVVMKGKDAISASLAECFITIDGTRYNFMQAINLEARMEKNKVEVNVLGSLGTKNKSVGWTGTGSATFHYNTSIFRKAMKAYKDSGMDFYFDMQITNEDPTSSVGKQVIVLKDCNMDSVLLTAFDADGEILEDDFDFTFEDWEMPNEFTMLQGMA